MKAQRSFGLAALVAVEAVLALVPVIVLGAAIEWPASLGFPAEKILPLVHAHLGEVRAGYAAYLAYSVMFFPLVAVLAGRFRSGPWGAGASIAVGLAALSALARAVGILRWLAPVPPLAAAFVTGDAATQHSAVALFNVVDSYGGAIGEAFGIGLFGGGALMALGVLLLAKRPAWGWWTVAVGVVQFVPFLSVFEWDFGPATTLAAVTLLVWLVSLFFLLGTARDDAAEGLGRQA